LKKFTEPEILALIEIPVKDRVCIEKNLGWMALESAIKFRSAVLSAFEGTKSD
jgi:hypothetical protein